MANHIQEKMADLVEMMAAAPRTTKQVPAVAWGQLLIYVPREVLETRLQMLDQRKEDGN